MGCIYEDRMDGHCTLTTNTEGDFAKESEQQGSRDGVCVVSDDPDPGISCDMYESDWTCDDCGTDLNINDCCCEEDD